MTIMLTYQSSQLFRLGLNACKLLTTMVPTAAPKQPASFMCNPWSHHHSTSSSPWHCRPKRDMPPLPPHPEGRMLHLRHAVALTKSANLFSAAVRRLEGRRRRQKQTVHFIPLLLGLFCLLWVECVMWWRGAGGKWGKEHDCFNLNVVRLWPFMGHWGCVIQSSGPSSSHPLIVLYRKPILLKTPS